MAKKSKKKPLRKRPGLVAALVCAALGLGLWGYMGLNASILHVKRADVAVKDLPPAFEGKTILYISDIDLCGLNTAARAADAVMQLQSIRPDVLILGGDFTSPTLGEILNKQADVQGMLAKRDTFLQYIQGFDAPMGKYVLASAADTALGDMGQTLKIHGFSGLNGNLNRLTFGSETLFLVGVNQEETRMSEYGGAFRSGDCVICVAESPDCFPRIMTAEAKDGGAWVDLCLAGGTHGGQVRVLGRSALTLSEVCQQYLSGWSRAIGVPMLTSSGLGCEGANLRLGSQAEAWVIRLGREAAK